MCLFVNNKRKDAQVAKSPITVYKILLKNENVYRTPMQDTICEPGAVLKGRANKEHMEGNNYNIENIVVESIEGEGVHAYKTLFAARHSLIPCDSWVNTQKCYITEWEIPAGATYWEGTTTTCLEIAATEMKFIKVTEEWKAADDVLLAPNYVTDTLERIATHYFTDEGEIKPIEDNEKIPDYHLCWSIEELKKLVPETIFYDGTEYKLFMNKDGDNCVHVGYKSQEGITLFYNITSTNDKGFIYGWLVTGLKMGGYIS